MSAKRKTPTHRAYLDAERIYREGTIEHNVYRVVAQAAWLRGYYARQRDERRASQRSARAAGKKGRGKQ